MIRPITGLFLSLLLLSNCVRQDPTVIIEEDVTAVLRLQEENWNKKDIEGYMSGYWQSEDLTFVSGGNVRKGWQAVLTSYKERYTPDKMGTLTFSEIVVYPVSVNAALVHGKWDLAREPDNPGGRFTLFFRKFAGGWKIIHDHTSSRDN